MDGTDYYGATGYYGAEQSSEIKPIKERLRDYYSPSDFVTVMNIDTKVLRYQVASPESEDFHQPTPYARERIAVSPPQRYELQPGQSKLCPAYEADMMLTTLIKQITSSDIASKIATGELVKDAVADWNDPATQKSILKEALLGKEDVLGRYNNERPTTTTISQPQSELERDLVIDEPRATPRIGRPRKEA